MRSPFSILREFFQLGLTSFGGPTAHVAFFRERFVEKRRWLTDREYADLLALCQFLPGPASSQIGLGIGWKKGGALGALAAWVGFTLPSAVALTMFGLVIAGFGGAEADSGGEGGIAADAGWLRGLQIAVVAVIAKAVWTMSGSLCPDRSRKLIALGAAALMLALGAAWAQILVILAGAALGLCFVEGGWLVNKREASDSGSAATPGSQLSGPTSPAQRGRLAGVACLAAFGLLLFGLPLLEKILPGHRLLEAFSAMYRSGSLVFGGGHVVLPLLSRETVGPGWITSQEFMAGYGAAQTVPGPLFTFSAYLGAVMESPHSPWLMAAVSLAGIFLPAWLLVLGAMPFWESIASRPVPRRALAGTNAAVVGLLGSSLYDPVWTGAIRGSGDLVFLLGVSAAFFVLRWPAWLVVILAGVAGGLVFGFA